MLRKHANLSFQMRSGHVPLNLHLHRIQRANLPVCPHVATVTVKHYYILHYVLRFPAHENARREIGTSRRETPEAYPNY